MREIDLVTESDIVKIDSCDESEPTNSVNDGNGRKRKGWGF